jgi:hypothetical protein
MEKNADKIRDLWTRMTAETDPDKLPELNNELGVVLDEYERNLATSPQHETLYVDRANGRGWIMERRWVVFASPGTPLEV